MKSTMKAIVKKYPQFDGLVLEDVPIPEIGDDEVLVKIKRTAICGTDVHIYDWNEWAQRTIKTPMTIGHEFVGTIVQVGKHVKNLSEGTLVSAEGHVICHTCRNCLAGKGHLCKTAQGIGVNRTGIFAEYAAIPAANIWVADENIPLDLLACFDPLGNATHTALSFNMVGEDVLVTGAGPIGIMAVAIARHVGARNIVVTDVNPYRLDMAMEFGATAALDVRTEKIEDCFKKLNIKEGFDIGLEMSGNGRAFNDMINAMYNGGQIALLGLINNDTVIDWDKVIFNGLTIKGIYGREIFETWYKMSAMIQSGLDLEKIITHRFSYKDFHEGFETMRSGKSGKIVLNWE